MEQRDVVAAMRFAAKIDCRFPYRDRASASALIAEGWSISLDAAFGVLHEICRKPKSSPVTRQRQHQLMDEWAARFDHPLREPLLRCARALTEKKPLAWEEAVSVMEEVGKFDAQFSALNIAYFSGDCDSDEGASGLEAARDRICRAWSE
jgi:hypothetical protein